MARSSSTWRWSLVALAGVGGVALLAGCGGGGSGGGVDRPAPGFQLGRLPTVQKLETPLGLTGSRGAGANVFVSFNLRDREYNPASVQLEYGWDVNGGMGRISFYDEKLVVATTSRVERALSQLLSDLRATTTGEKDEAGDEGDDGR